jgi:signal transduction histidine kinase
MTKKYKNRQNEEATLRSKGTILTRSKALAMSVRQMRRSVPCIYHAIIAFNDNGRLVVGKSSGRMSASREEDAEEISVRSLIGKVITDRMSYSGTTPRDYRRLCSSLRVNPEGTAARKFLIHPMVSGKKAIGAMLFVRDARDRAFTQAEEKTANSLAKEAASVLASSYLCRYLRKENSALKAEHQSLERAVERHGLWQSMHANLIAMADEIVGHIESDHVLEVAAKYIVKYSDADQCIIALFDKKNPKPKLCHSWTKRKAISVPKATTCDLASAMYTGKRQQNVAVLSANSGKTVDMGAISHMRKNGVQSALAATFDCGNNLECLLCLLYIDTVKTPSQLGVGFVRAAGEQVSDAIQFAELYGKVRTYSDHLERQNEDLSVLLDLNRKFSSTFDLDKTLRYAVKTFVNRLDVERAAIFVIDPEDERMIHMERAAKPGTGEGWFDIRRLMEEPVDFVNFLRRKDPLIIRDFDDVGLKSKYVRGYFKDAGYKSLFAMPLVSRQHKLGAFFLGYVTEGERFSERDLDLYETFGSLIATATENCRLMDFISGKYRRAGWLSSRIIDAQEKDRRRLARNLHDEIGASLAMLKINLHMARKKVGWNDTGLNPFIEELDGSLGEIIAQVRNLTADLRPPVLDDLGLGPAINWYVEQFSGRSDIKIKIANNLSNEKRFPDSEIMIYRVVQEALTNIAKHAHATKVDIRLAERGTDCELIIKDNGNGFDPRILDDENSRTKGFGLLNIKQQVENRMGEFEIRSTAGKGTRLKVRISWTE